MIRPNSTYQSANVITLGTRTSISRRVFVFLFSTYCSPLKSLAFRSLVRFYSIASTGTSSYFQLLSIFRCCQLFIYYEIAALAQRNIVVERVTNTKRKAIQRVLDVGEEVAGCVLVVSYVFE